VTVFQPQYEAMPVEQLRELELERLNATLARVYDNVPTYREKFDEAGISPTAPSLDALETLPFTVKDDLRNAYPYGCSQPL
jgi:phenylacetate-CoA ligase